MGYKPAPGIKSLSPYQKRSVLLRLGPRKGVGFDVMWHHIPLLILLGLALFTCYNTAGNPYRQMSAELEAQREQEILQEWENFDKEVDAAEEEKKAEEKRLAEIKRKEEEERMATDPWAVLGGTNGMFPSFMMGDEEVSEEDANRPSLPAPFMPDFWPTFFLVVVVLLCALVELSQLWSIDIQCWLQFTPVSQLKSGGYVKVTPENARSLTELVEVTSSKHQEDPVLFFTFQKRRYFIDWGDDQVQLIEGDLSSIRAAVLDAGATGLQGYRNEEQVVVIQEKFGKNKFDIPMPTFLDLIGKQMLAPMTVFQLFCNGLWLLDEAWKYAIFGMFSIVTFEATSVFSRLKHIKAIRGMGSKSTETLVFRSGSWRTISTEELVPGDLVSIRMRDESGGDVVPCDCLVLHGSAVMNEASLTGESVPQMKEALVVEVADRDRPIDIKGSDKVHVLYGGTALIQVSAGAGEKGNSSSTDPSQWGDRELKNAKRTPDGGCLAYVLQTGFASSQGELVRMIEFSSSNNNRTAGDPENLRESFMLIGLLLVFAIAASAWVLKQGLEEGVRTRYQLLIHCVLIITSVVPSDLPMQLALAVNASLMYLMKAAVYCTEPFRVPIAGKVDMCFFDKTGTLTTDQLHAFGIIPADSKTETALSGEMQPMKESSIAAARVIGGCHSLLEVDGKIMGDPIETAAIHSVVWKYDHSRQVSSPAFGRHHKGEEEKKEEAGGPHRIVTASEKKREEEKAARRKEKEEALVKSRPWGRLPQQVRILHRYHFKSKLQRMSVLASVQEGSHKPTLQVLTKGSPEAIGKLLVDGNKPSWYTESYTKLARRGLRVIALAYRDVPTLSNGAGAPSNLSEAEAAKQPREWAEKGLKFAGFVAFQCLVRKDSAKVVTNLRKSNLSVVMITGDNILTAVHVAEEVSLTQEKARVLVLDEEGDEMKWVNAESGATHGPYSFDELSSLSKEYDLCMTGPGLRRIHEEVGSDKLGTRLDVVKVFARMSPQDKELVLSVLNDKGHVSLMCGDGANDVGALKQAHVGVALLTGFGSLNTVKAKGEKSQAEEEEEEKKKKMELEADEDEEMLAKMGLFERIKYEADKKNRLLAVAKEAAGKKKKVQAEQKEKMMIEIQEETKRLEAAGESWAPVKAAKNVMTRKRAEAQAKAKKGGGAFTASAASLAVATSGIEALDEVDDGSLPMLKLGDASVAAPFTSKWPSIRSVYDIIRLGRCTLVSRVQNNLIICLSCLISSYSLSVLYLEGVKFSDYQLTATGMLITTCHLAISHTSPLKTVSSVRPLGSMFHPALFISLAGQFIIHLFCMIYSVSVAKTYLPEDFKQETHTKFYPNLVNTVVFLIETMQHVSVLMVNYKGRPFQPGLTESKALLNALGMCFFGLLVCAFEVLPGFNRAIGMVPFPDDQLRSTVLYMLLLDSIGALLWDRICVYLWANHIHRASSTHINTYAIFLGVRKLVVSCLMIYLVFWQGGIFGLMGGYWVYKQGWM